MDRAREKIPLLLDADSITALHDEVWATPDSRLHGWWRRALGRYALIAPAPQIAFRTA